MNLSDECHIGKNKSYRRYLPGGGGYCLSANYFGPAPLCELVELHQKLRACQPHVITMRNGNVFLLFPVPFDEESIERADKIMKEWLENV